MALRKKALFYSNWALLRTELRMYYILTEFELMYSKIQKKKKEIGFLLEKIELK